MPEAPSSADWLSHLLDMMPVRGRLDLRCFFGAPWQVAEPEAAPGEIRYHAILGGSAMVESPGGKPERLIAGDILVLPRGSAHRLSDGSGARPVAARERTMLNLRISENAGLGDRFDMLCGRFILTPPHDRFLQDYLPPRLIVHAADNNAATAKPGTRAQLAGLVALMRSESTAENLGGRAMLDALSTGMFTLILRLASEARDAPSGLLALVGHPRLAPALAAMFDAPARNWSLPELARLCNMSRATFVRHFQQKLGRSAADFLTEIRMTLAANRLRQPGATTSSVASAIGYQSDAAFQRAFKQHMGMTPAEWRRAAP